MTFFNKKYSCVLCNPNSDPLSSDYDGDGFNDDIDPDPFTYIKIKAFGTEEYEKEVLRRTLELYDDKIDIYKLPQIENEDFDLTKLWEIQQENIKRITGAYILENIQRRQNEIARVSLSIMMQDVNDCEQYLFSVSDENWLKFCLFFNECVQTYDAIDEELHYFRLKLNRTPSSFAELISNKSEWEIYSKDNTRYHMNNGRFKSSNPKYRDYSSYNNEYNMKFVNKNGLYEVIVSPKHDLRGMSHEEIYKELNNAYNWAILTADPNNNDENFRYDPVNVGTYNYYASLPSYGKIKGAFASKIHKKYDVSPFYEWANVKGLPYGNSTDEKKANGDFYNNNANKKVYDDWSVFFYEVYN